MNVRDDLKELPWMNIPADRSAIIGVIAEKTLSDIEAETRLRLEITAFTIARWAKSFEAWYSQHMFKEIHTSSYLKWMAQRSVVSGNARIGETKRQFIVDERKRRALLRKCRNRMRFLESR